MYINVQRTPGRNSVLPLWRSLKEVLHSILMKSGPRVHFAKGHQRMNWKGHDTPARKLSVTRSLPQIALARLRAINE